MRPNAITNRPNYFEYSDRLPRISVINLVYKTGRFSIESLKSVLATGYPEFEFLVFDDASPDDSADVVSKWLADNIPHATFEKNTVNLGINRTLNKGLQKATGEFILILADDLIRPNYVSDMLSKFGHPQDPTIGAVYGDCRLIRADGGVIAESYFKWINANDRSNREDLFLEMLQKNIVAAPACLIRTAAARELGGWDTDLLFEDWDFWLRLLQKYRMVRCDTPVADYVKRTGSLTMTTNALYEITRAKALLKWIDHSPRARKSVIRGLSKIFIKSIDLPSVIPTVYAMKPDRHWPISIRVLKRLTTISLFKSIFRRLIVLHSRTRKPVL